MTTTAHNFVSVVDRDFNPEPEDSVFDNLYRQYERVVFQSIITAFSLDAFIKDQRGGDVDTIHNVRSSVEYKNAANKKAYEERESYNSHAYNNKEYIKIRENYDEQRNSSKGLEDAYTGKMLEKGQKQQNIDHVIPKSEIHKDRGRVLSGLNGKDLANSPENLRPTNPHTNQTKNESPMDKFLEKRGNEYTEEQKERMRKADKVSRTSYNRKINIAYYTSPKFWRDTGKAAISTGVKMGLRQTLGLVMTEVWFAVQGEIAKAADSFEAKLNAIAEGIKRGFKKAKNKFRELLSKFGEGAISGIFASLSTTLCNIFFTTAKNVVRIIRQTWASIVEATKILIFNPDHLPFAERMQAALKIIAAGASIVIGTMVQEAVHAALTPYLGTIPVLGTELVDIISVFAGTLCTGFLTVSVLYLIDNNPFEGFFENFFMKEINQTIAEYKRQARLFEEHAAKLAELDIAKFERETALCHKWAMNLEKAQDDQELNTMLKEAMFQMGISNPCGERSLDEFMNDPDAELCFDA
jgi:hypothetical protein